MVKIKKENLLLEINDMNISFKMYEEKDKQKNIKTLSNLSLEVFKGEVLAIVGYSDSGKSLHEHGMTGILPDNAILSGSFFYNGEELIKEKLESLRGKDIVLVPQSISYLDPLMKVGKQVRKSSKSKKAKIKQRESFER